MPHMLVDNKHRGNPREISSQNSLCPGQDLNWTPCERMSEVLLLEETFSWQYNELMIFYSTSTKTVSHLRKNSLHLKGLQTASHVRTVQMKPVHSTVSKYGHSWVHGCVHDMSAVNHNLCKHEQCNVVKRPRSKCRICPNITNKLLLSSLVWRVDAGIQGEAFHTPIKRQYPSTLTRCVIILNDFLIWPTLSRTCCTPCSEGAESSSIQPGPVTTIQSDWTMMSRAPQCSGCSCSLASSLQREPTGWCINGMHASMPMGTIFNGLYSFEGTIPEQVSLQKPCIQPTLIIQNYQLTNILAMWLSKTSAKAIFFGTS
jgi:hypothetical protein